MENLDVMVLRTLLVWRQAGQRALLATVVRTWGRRLGPSAPSWPCAKRGGGGLRIRRLH